MFSDGENIWVFVRDAYRPRDDNTQIKLEDTGRDRMHRHSLSNPIRHNQGQAALLGK